jgi:hypothetical protein
MTAQHGEYMPTLTPFQINFPIDDLQKAWELWRLSFRLCHNQADDHQAEQHHDAGAEIDRVFQTLQRCHKPEALSDQTHR